MEEKKYLYIIIFLTFIISILGSYTSKNFDLRLIFSKLYIDYTAEINIDNQIYINEKYFDYLQTEKYRRLFRKWNSPITYEGKLNRPFIKIEKVYGDGESYVKDWKGKIYGNLRKSSLKVIETMAGKNEAGIVNPDFFKKGNYLFLVNYKIFPPVEKNKEIMHLNLKLADYHVPYREVIIKIKDKNKKIQKIYPHIPNFSLEKIGKSYIIKGNAPENSIVEIEMLLNPFNINGFTTSLKNIKNFTEDVNKHLFLIRETAKIIQHILFIFVILFPFLFIIYYLKFGSEKEFTVPEFLSFIPNKNRRPYLVNLVFNGDSFNGDENAFFSTLLDLQKKGKIKIETNGDLSIKIIDTNVSDSYEKKVMDFLQKNSTNINGENYFFSYNIKSKIDRYKLSKNIAGLKSIKSEIEMLMKYKSPDISQQFVENKGKNIFTIFGFLFFLITIGLGVIISTSGWVVYSVVDLYPLFILSITLSTQILVIILTPTQFLGRWKKEFYKEKLQWNGFKNFLSDMAMIKKYSPKDLSIWKEWLIYGTALGVAKEVEKAMNDLKISIPEIKYETEIRTHFNTAYTSLNKEINRLTKELSSQNSKGGFGRGGGFGGGGAGGG